MRTNRRIAKPLATVGALLALSACNTVMDGLEQADGTMDRLMHAGHDHPMDHIVTVWRYAEFGDDENELQYVGPPDLVEAQELVSPAAPAGPMRIDCSRYSDFGVLVRRIRLYHRVNRHKVDFRLTDEAGQPVRLKSYVRNRWSGETAARSFARNNGAQPYSYIKGIARFIGPHENGIYRMQVTHLDDVLDEAEFEFYNCEERPTR